MQIIRNDVGALFHDALWAMKVCGFEEESRNGKVKTIQEPVILTTVNPERRVLFCKERKENPVFHFAECLWMMAGCRDVDWISQYNPRMREFSDHGTTLHGAYGFRWRHYSPKPADHKGAGFDQLIAVCEELKRDSWSRRVVLSMWCPELDLGNDLSKDIPCNTHIYFRRRGDSLNMTVCNRSNDLVWGALGSNVVHFSFLLELIAHEVGLKMGQMHQITNNLHIYERHWHFLDVPPYCETYEEVGVLPYHIIRGDLASWLAECERVVNGERGPFSEPFFEGVAIPILDSNFNDCQAPDWKLACKRYIER